jgi:hypothetical protein
LTQQAKASPAGSTEAGGKGRGLIHRAFATRGASESSKGMGARSTGRLRATLAVLAIAIAAFAITAAPASAAPPTTKVNTISAVSYTSAHVTGRITTTGGLFKSTNYSFQYSKNPGTENWTTGLEGGLAGSKTNETVEGDITGLKGGTQYFVRLVASVLGPGFVLEEGVSPEPNPSFTTLGVDPPENVAISAPPTIFSTSAELSGTVTRPSNPDAAFDITCRYEYISDAQFNENVTKLGSGKGYEGAVTYPCAQNPVKEPGVAKTVTAHIGCFHPPSHEEYPYYDGPCLEVATTYHARLIAENSAPGNVVKENTFTTLPVVAKPVVLTADNATDVSYLNAKVSGSVERPAGIDPALDVYCNFEHVTDAQFKATAFAEAVRTPCEQTPRDGYNNMHPLTNTGPTPVTAKLHLASGVEYHVRLNAENGGGPDTKTAPSTFTTLPGGEPTFSIDPNPIAGYTTINLLGHVTYGLGAENEEIVYEFEFAEVGTENWTGCCQYGRGVPHGTGPQPISFEYTRDYGIKPSTEYKYRIILQRAESSIYETSPEPYPTIKTKPLAEPNVTLNPITDFTANTAQFSGTVNTSAPSGTLDDLAKAAYKTEWEFKCTPECPGNSGTVEGEEGSKAVSLEALELNANTYYEVQLVARNGFYTVESPVQAFQTPLIAPTVTALPGVSDGEGGYFLEGIVNSNNTKLSTCKFEYGTTATYPNTYEAPCLPSPSGPDEVQLINVDATGGQFKLSFRGQTTADLPYNATPAEVQTALRALPQVGATGVNVSGTAKAYKATFAGPLAGTNVAQIKGSNGTTPLSGGSGVSASTETEGGSLHPVSIATHVEALTIGSTYHFRIIAISRGGTSTTVDRTFIPTLTPPETCANDQVRRENSSFALPECRAYEIVSPSGKEGYDASLRDYDGGERVEFASGAANILKSGQNSTTNHYVTERTAAGWKTFANLNGSSGSIFDDPSNFTVDEGAGYPTAYSPDLRSSIWSLTRDDCGRICQYLRHPDGTFTPIGLSGVFSAVATSADLSHLLTWGGFSGVWGPGVYEFIGTGMPQPRRVDLDNSGDPISSCADANQFTASNRSVSSDGSTVVNNITGNCGGTSPPADELWARVNGTTTFDVSASHCDRVAPAACNAPSNPTFVATTPDGSRVFFTTTQQLVNGDVDQTNDIYACDLPSGNPAPAAGKANPCSAFSQISVAEGGAAEVESVLTTSEDGSTVLFTAKGVLAANEDPLEEKAVAGDENLYVWHQDPAHPAGQTSFVGKVAANDVIIGGAQATPDGHYVVFTSAIPLVETDTDASRDVYRVDAETGKLDRVSTNILGVGGNGPFDAFIPSFTSDGPKPGAVSDDGQKIVFTTSEPLAPVDGNGEPDAYLWTPSHTSLISTGAVGGGVSGTGINQGQGLLVAIDGSGHDIYFQTRGVLTPADVDTAVDIYDARVDGGFSFAEAAACSGEACQPPPSPSSPAPISPANKPNGEGNVTPKHCPKGKIVKGDKCVKKHGKKHHKKKHKKAGHNRGGSK